MADATPDNQPTPTPNPPNPHARLEKWIWILIYGGLFAVILGLAIGRAEPVIGWSMGVPGALAAAVGIVLIYVRSRLDDK